MRVVRRWVHAAAREPPLIARDHRARSIGPIAHGEDGVRVVDSGGGVRLVDAVGEQFIVTARVRLELQEHLPRYRLPRRIERFRRVEPHQRGAFDDIPLPAAPGERPAVAEQEAVARLDLLGRQGRRRGVIEHARHEFAPPIQHFKEQSPVPFGGVNGLHEAEVGGERRLPRIIPRRLVEIDDRRVRRVRGVNGEVDHPVDPLVAPASPNAVPSAYGPRARISNRVTAMDTSRI